MRRRAAIVLTALLASPAAAQEADPLVPLINEFRTTSPQCDGKRTAAAGPLAPEPRLSRPEVGASPDALQAALKRVGYRAARVQLVVLIGPSDAPDAMAALKNRYCEVLTRPGFSDIGVSRTDGRWQIVLAQPLLSADLGDWREAGREILKLVNDARAQARTCGERRFMPAPPVSWSAKLGATARAHSRDMAKRNYFAHTAKDGTAVGDRAAREEYRWRRIGENIATGQGSARQVVEGWLASPHHCVNIMEPAFTQMGAAYAVNKASDTGIYWTQVFGTPRR